MLPMSALITALRQFFYRPWMLASLAALASAAVLLTASIGIALQQMKQSESAQMNAQGERFLDRLEQVFGQLREGVDDLQAQPLRGCNPAMLALLQQVGLGSRFIYEAAYVDVNVACSNRGGARAFVPTRAPDIQGPTYSYWLNTTTEPNENLAGFYVAWALDRRG
jgi:sensor c-di-GMP phosphodiesterase-like protein